MRTLLLASILSTSGFLAAQSCGTLAFTGTGAAGTTLGISVTGATAGFGAATAKRFAKAGAKVVISGRRAERLDALKAELGDARVHAFVLDVRDAAAVQAAVAGLRGVKDQPNLQALGGRVGAANGLGHSLIFVFRVDDEHLGAIHHTS